MDEDGNTVNMEKRGYHHGDLRRALIEAGLQRLERCDAESLSLRELARATGVSATAVYRHFPDKNALLDALAAEGMTRLGAAQRAAAEAAGGGAEGFIATGVAYVRFALANPALFRLTFAAVSTRNMLDAPPEHLPDSMAFLRENAAAAAEQAGADPRLVAIRAWAVAHGLALLLLEQQLEPEEGLIERVIGGMPIC